jgi:hypothetical protein
VTPKLGETIVLDFVTHSPTTAAVTDADSTPTAEVFEDATDTTVVALTVVKRTSKTGNYRVSIACTALNGFEAAKSYNVVASATVGGIAAKSVIGRFQVRAQSVDDVLLASAYTAPLSAAGTRSAVGLATANLDAQLAGLTPLTAAGVRTAVGLAAANLDTQLGALPSAAAVADKLLGRAVAGGADGGRTVGQALKALRNKVEIAGGLMTIYESDDVTPSWTATVTTAAGNPISGVDPA